MKRPVLVALAGLVAVLLVGYGLWGRSSPAGTALRVRALAARGLMDSLRVQGAGEKVLVIANPFARQRDTPAPIRETEAAGIRGVESGLPSGLKLGAVAYPNLKPEAVADPHAALEGVETTTPLSYLVSADAFDLLRGEHPDCGVFVSLIGLPADLGRVQCWTSNGPPRFALLLPDLRILGGLDAVRSALGRDKLAAMVLPRPDAPGADVPLRGPWKTQFEQRFVLVNRDTLDETVRRYPALFSAK